MQRSASKPHSKRNTARFSAEVWAMNNETVKTMLMDSRKAVLVYQAGIANVFAVNFFGETSKQRHVTVRLWQGDFRGAANFAFGLEAAGVEVRTMGSNMAGDIAAQPWTYDLDAQPFVEK